MNTHPSGRASIMYLLKLIAIISISLFSISGCGFVYDETITGSYRLVAVDDSSQISVCYTLNEEGDCIGRIPETVFSVGWNDRFIVAKQYSSDNKSVTNYFILDMMRDNLFADPEMSVMGPLSVTEFKEKTLLLGLPAFTKDIKLF